jgi:hypothetical protein
MELVKWELTHHSREDEEALTTINKADLHLPKTITTKYSKI